MIKLKNKIAFYLMRMIKSKKKRDFFINRKQKQIPNFVIPSNIGKKIYILKNNLEEKGYLDLGIFLSENEVEKIIDKVRQFNCFDPYRDELGEFKSSNIPKDVHVANYKRNDLLSVKEILDIANNTDVLKTVKNFLGATPTISNINMWWSLSDKKEAEQAQFFHRDVDDFKFCKLFVYLTDVSMENGPHVYVEGSSISEKLRKIKRYDDDEIENEFGKENIKYFTAPQGSAFIVDTYGFHKGLLPSKGNRLLLQIQYSLSPIGIENYEPIEVEAHPYNKYINRLLIK